MFFACQMHDRLDESRGAALDTATTIPSGRMWHIVSKVSSEALVHLASLNGFTGMLGCWGNPLARTFVRASRALL
jgi:hypothetical protein